MGSWNPDVLTTDTHLDAYHLKQNVPDGKTHVTNLFPNCMAKSLNPGKFWKTGIRLKNVDQLYSKQF